MNTFDDYKNSVSSEKLVLAVLHAAKRLVAWSLHSGSIYKISNFDVAVIVSIGDSGYVYTEVQSLAEVTAAKFYNDRENKVLYLRTTGSDNPNGRFLVLTLKMFFSNAPVVLPHDLSTGFDVSWEPMIKSTSTFGVEMDTVSQTSEAIEGSGTLTLHNDSAFWRSNFDKLTFENKPCFIYSHNRQLAANEAKLIFRGLVEKKAYSPTQVQFSLKDLLSELKAPVALANIEDLTERSSTGLAKAKQRMILGRVFGHRPTNLDEVLEGYPLVGTISINSGSDTVTGSGTSFLAKLSPDDTLVVGGTDYTIATVTSNTSLTLTEAYSAVNNLSGAALIVKPAEPKRYMNRKWLVAGHALRQPTTTVQAGSTITRLLVGDTTDMYSGDTIYIGALGGGEALRIDNRVSSELITLADSLVSVPSIGTAVFKPPLQNVRIDDVLLTYYRDYTIDADTGILTLSDDAEKNAAPIRQMANNLTFTNGSRTVTGASLNSLLRAGSVISCVSQAEYFEVLSVDSETQVTLRTAATFSATAKGLYKNFILDADNSVLTCDVLGRTEDGTTTGALIETAPSIIKALLLDLGLSAIIDTDSFNLAEEIAYQPIGTVIPSTYNSTTAPTYREVFNTINRSVFGSLVQTEAFRLSYLVLHPNKSPNALRLREPDVISFSTTSTSDKLVKTVSVIYKPMEYNYLLKNESVSTQQKTSDVSKYLIKTDRERSFSTILVETADAERQANRWSMILENSSTAVKIKTKLQAISLEVGAIVDLEHRKLYESLGSSTPRKLAMVESVKKSGSSVELTLVDLSNTFNRIGSYTNITTSWADSDGESRLYGGFISDSFGLIDNDENSFGCNLIW